MAIRNFISDNQPIVQPHDAIEQFTRGQQLRNYIQQGQQNEQELELGKQRIDAARVGADKAKRIEDDTRMFGEVYLAAKGNPDETVRLAAERGIHPDLIQNFQKHNAELAAKAAQTDAALLPIKKQKLEQAQGMLMEVEGMAPEALAQAWPALYQKALQLDPEAKDYLSPMQPPTAQQFAALNAAVATQDYHLKKEAEKRLTATAVQQATAASDVHTQKAAELPGIVSKTQTGVALDRATLDDPNLLNPGQRATATAAEGAATQRAMTLGEQRRHNLASEAAATRRAAAMEAGKGEGRGLSEGAIKALEPNKALSDKLGNLLETFKDDFAGHLITGGAGNAIGKLGGEAAGLITEGQTDFWQGYQDFVNRVRKELFGSALTATEKGEFEKAMIDPRSAPSVVKTNLARQKSVVDAALNRRADTYKAGGFNGGQIDIYRPAQQAPGGGGQSGRKVGDVVSIGGKQVKIKAIHGDGSFDGDEVK